MEKCSLITGAAGFSGSYHVESFLKEGRPVVAQVRKASNLTNLSEVTDSPGLKLAKLDLTDYKLVDEMIQIYKPDTVIHLAANSNVNQMLQTPDLAGKNFESTFNILRAVSLFSPNTNVVIASSSHAIGNPLYEYPQGIPETAQPNPQNPYGIEKYDERMLLYVFKQMGLSVGEARIFNHTGPKRTNAFLDGRLAQEAAQAKINGEKWLVTIASKDYTRGYGDVRDWVEASKAISIYGDSGEAYNVGRDEPRNMAAMIDVMSQAANVPYEIIENPALLRPGDPLVIYPNTQKLENLGWSKKISYHNMLEDSVEYQYNKLLSKP